jgi:hypothetical protein
MAVALLPIKAMAGTSPNMPPTPAVCSFNGGRPIAVKISQSFYGGQLHELIDWSDGVRTRTILLDNGLLRDSLGGLWSTTDSGPSFTMQNVSNGNTIYCSF